MKAKDKILEAAAVVFAEKSFEGARVDEIAEYAGVTKSLIYYHFKSKAEILNLLIDQFIEKLTRIYSCTEEIYVNQQSIVPSERIFSEVVPFYQSHQNQIRIILMESLKQKENPPILRVLHAVANSKEVIASKCHNLDYTTHDVLLKELMLNIIPLFMFTSLHESLMHEFNTDLTSTVALFVNMLEEVHQAVLCKGDCLSEIKNENIKEQ